MADVFTGATSAAGSGQLTNQVLTAYQRSAFFALRAGLVFDPFAKVKPGNLTSPGTPVKFPFWDDLAVATTPLTETVDVDAVGLGDSLVTVTPYEYGNAVLLTLRIRTDDFLIGFDSDVSNLLNYNMVNSIDALAKAAADASGTEVIHPGATAETDIVASDDLTVALVRQQRSKLESASVMPWEGNTYAGVIHPDVAYDLKSETGDGSWTAASQYSDASRIWTGEIGSFDGIRFVVTPRANKSANGGSSTVDTYTSYFFGQEFLAKAESIPPHMVLGPVTDKLMRFQPLGLIARPTRKRFRVANGVDCKKLLKPLSTYNVKWRWIYNGQFAAKLRNSIRYRSGVLDGRRSCISEIPDTETGQPPYLRSHSRVYDCRQRLSRLCFGHIDGTRSSTLHTAQKGATLEAANLAPSGVGVQAVPQMARNDTPTDVGQEGRSCRPVDVLLAGRTTHRSDVEASFGGRCRSRRFEFLRKFRDHTHRALPSGVMA